MTRFAIVVAVSATLLVATAADAAVPGALSGQRYVYADGWQGWPVAPKHVQHPIRGSFLDPRYPSREYHWGIDVNVNDDRPESSAPAGRTHRVYAVEGGVVAFAFGRRSICARRRLGAGHFVYWHVDPVVRAGQRVRPGQMIGWTCAGTWHLHLGEWAVVRGHRVWVNPLHRGGKIRPYSDTARPLIHEIRFHEPAMPPEFGRQLNPTKLQGLVDVRAWIGDPQSVRSWMVGRMAPLLADHHPYSVRVRLTRLKDRRTWAWTLFRADVWLSTQVVSLAAPVPFRYHYAPGSVANLRIPSCLNQQSRPHPRNCNGKYRLRLFATPNSAYWNTRAFRNGRYRINVMVSDISGNKANASAEAAVAN
jgi:hypothetical protein